MFGSLAKVASGAVSLLLLAATTSVSAAKKDNIDTDVTQLRAFTLEMPYIDEGFHMRNYDFGGDAIVNTMERIRLTPDLPSRMGSLWSTSTLPTDYWKDYINGLGVFFDTYPNGKHDFAVPFVMGMVGDGKTPYDGAHDGDANRLGMCEAYFRNLKQNSKAPSHYAAGGSKNFNALPNIPLPALKQAAAGSSYFGVVFKLILAAVPAVVCLSRTRSSRPTMPDGSDDKAPGVSLSRPLG
ncbi:concanavalin A-like lectin/glucanase domain-containing protein [Kickxella alabastrina]|uniref:concanavalin A-like lectin/glucanase domain-containing protein n=1 Tax=Kickxella alabastrina TaxID=61397 RepID=UPI00221F377D|nr:concanavalin A-like lectin/glucanase domain-containing protein [Kickxella alabastrina]KAI7830897.1 concanavalin A-like lectin/glucanase domain-containing protein [Kickxella alabastrina]